MIATDYTRFFSAGAMTGGFVASLLCFVFPSISIYVMLFYFGLALGSLYKLKDELHKLL